LYNVDTRPGKTKHSRRPDRAVYAPPGSRRVPGLGPAIKLDIRPVPKFSSPNLPPYRIEIETILGPVRLVTPINDFVALESGCVASDNVVDEDLPNVVEIFDFPETFKTDDLENCLHRNLSLANYYDLKWVDSTHALVIFADVDAANVACHIEDSLMKFRCLISILNFGTRSFCQLTEPRHDLLCFQSIETLCPVKNDQVKG
jgi:hypothetical protein